MTLVDAPDGVLMLGAYSWAYMQPKRKLLYNLFVTLLSVVVALGIGTYEALDLVADRFGLRSGIWAWLDAISGHYDTLGFGIIGAFAQAWAMSLVMHRRAGASRAHAEAIEPHPGTGRILICREGA